jgi:hypothetical protein
MNIKLLKSIKGVGLNINKIPLIAYPCKCITKKGVIDFCIYLVSQASNATLENQFPNNLLLSEVEEIKESEYALPYNIRLATTKAEDVRMGFYPTQVESSDRKLYILNGPTHFLKDEDRKGKDFMLIENLKHESEAYKYYNKQKDNITYII